MLKFENDCVGCGLPCLGNACRYNHVPHLYCDICGDDAEELYDLDGQEICESCLELYFEEDEAEHCDYCGDETTIFKFFNDSVCSCCIKEQTRMKWSDFKYDGD